MVEETLQQVRGRPVLVIDECFESDYGDQLIGQGVQDYLDAKDLSSQKLTRCIEWAILRNGYRAAPQPSERLRGREDGDKQPCLAQIYRSLPPQERRVLDFLAAGLTPKQIAARFGTSPKTVWTQLAKLRDRFCVNSNHALSLLVLRVLSEENAAE